MKREMDRMERDKSYSQDKNSNSYGNQRQSYNSAPIDRTEVNRL